MEVLCIGNVKVTSHHIIQRQRHCPRNAMYYMFSTYSLADKSQVCKTVLKENEKVSHQGKMYTKKLQTIKHVDPLSLASPGVDFRPQCSTSTDVPGHCHISCVLTECIHFVWGYKSLEAHEQLMGARLKSCSFTCVILGRRHRHPNMQFAVSVWLIAELQILEDPVIYSTAEHAAV